MSGPGQYWLGSAFALLGIVCIALLMLLATGYLRVDSELPALVIGAVLVLLLWLGIARR